jgi:predicted dehydrogenase
MTDAQLPEPMSDGEVSWGILATGGIARAFTRDLLAHGHRVAAVGSRSAESARGFAQEFGIPNAHPSYDDLVADPDVDVIYVATPHNYHAGNALAALHGGKHVLVEKPFTVNAGEAREVFDAAQSSGLVAMEAMWTRFLPHMAFVRSVLAGGRLGEVRSLHADHTQRLPADPVHRLNDPGLAGGALLDLGVYPLSFAHDILGHPVEVTARATFTDTGVDESVAIILRHENDAVSTSFSSMRTQGRNTAAVLGTEGRIEVDAVWYGPTTVTVRDPKNDVLDRFERPVSGRGMQYQAAELERLVAANEVASPLMPPGSSIQVMATMDEIRTAIGLRYPSEEQRAKR